MQPIRALILLVALLAPVLAAPQAPRLPRVLLISIDGLSPSAYMPGSTARIPNLRALAAAGAYATGVAGVVPTVTYPSHTTLITGVTPAVHGIVDNRIVDPEGRAMDAWHWYADWIKVPTLPGAVRARGHVASVNWPVTVGMELEYNVPEFWRSRHEETLSLLKALARPAGVLDTVGAGRGRPMGWPMSDRDRTDIARFLIGTKPLLLMLHLVEYDAVQHDQGPSSPRAAETLERIDGYVGELLQALETAGTRWDTTVAVVSDHGFLPIHTQVQPNAAFREAGVLNVSSEGRLVDWEAWFHASGGSGFVYLKQPDDATVRSTVERVVRQLASDPANGVESVWSRADLTRLGAHPDAVFGLAMARGFYLGGGTDALRKAASAGGGHGFDPRFEEMNAALILSGNGVQPRGSLGIVRMTQIAPTLARLLQVSLSPQADRPIW